MPDSPTATSSRTILSSSRASRTLATSAWFRRWPRQQRTWPEPSSSCRLKLRTAEPLRIRSCSWPSFKSLSCCVICYVCLSSKKNFVASLFGRARKNIHKYNTPHTKYQPQFPQCLILFDLLSTVSGCPHGIDTKSPSKHGLCCQSHELFFYWMTEYFLFDTESCQFVMWSGFAPFHKNRRFFRFNLHSCE